VNISLAMSSDDQKWYDLRSNTNTRTQYKPAKLQKNPQRQPNTASYIPAPYTDLGYLLPYTGSGYSAPYTAPRNPLPYTAPMSSRQIFGPANPTPYTGTTYSSPYAASMNSKPYVDNVYSSSYASSKNPTPYVGFGYSSSYATPSNPAPYNGPGYSKPLQYATLENPRPYADSGYPRQSPSSVPPLQYARPGYSAPSDNFGKPTDQLLDDLIGQFSKTHINQRPSTQNNRSVPVSAPPRGDAINEVVQGVLIRDLKKLGNEKLLPTNPVFDLARQFARTWDISDEAVNSHIRLACGYFKFPVILLLNPAPTHEFMPFDQMVNECKTLRWIEDVLYGIGLGLGDVIILDACTLLGNDRIKQLGTEGKRKKQQAMAEAYNVTQEMLRLIQPNIILSCQCSTSFPEWNAGGHVIARQLCSSIRGAKDRVVKEVYLNEHIVNVIQAYHPSGFLNNKGDRKAHHDTFGYILKGIFQTVYFHCANWKSQHLIATLASSNTTN